MRLLPANAGFTSSCSFVRFSCVLLSFLLAIASPGRSLCRLMLAPTSLVLGGACAAPLPLAIAMAGFSLSPR